MPTRHRSTIRARRSVRSACRLSSPVGTATLLCGLLALASACTNTSSSSASSAAPETTQPKPAPTGGALPDLTLEFESGQCEEINGAQVAGADSYFHGSFTLDGDAVSGHETWWLHANKTWEEKGGTSCTIRWQAKGSKTTPGACRDCDFGLKLAASPEIGASTCPEALLKREARSQDLQYDVKLSSNGEAFIYFSKSGNLLGQGFHKDNQISYRTQHQCKWF